MTGRKRLRVAVSPGDVYLVPGDMHFPTHDEAAVDAMVRWFEDRYVRSARGHRCGVVLQGDTEDLYGISKYPKKAQRLYSKSKVIDEVKAATPFLSWAAGLPLGAYKVLGNHEGRLARLFDEHPALDGCAISFGEITGLNGIDGLEILDPWSRVFLGDSVMIVHGDEPYFPKRAHLVASKYPDVVTLYGHTHRAESYYTTSYGPDGRPRIRAAFNVGHMCDVAQQDYVSDPNWQTGFAVVEFFGERGGEGQGAPRPFFRVQQHLVFRDSEGRAVVA